MRCGVLCSTSDGRSCLDAAVRVSLHARGIQSEAIRSRPARDTRLHLLHLPRYAGGPGGTGQTGLLATAAAVREPRRYLGRGGPSLGRPR